MKFLRSLLGLTALAAVLSAPAQAVPMLRVTDGTSTITITDQLAGDSNAASDVVTWIGNIGAWAINVSTGVSERFPQIHLDLNSINGTAGASGSGTLTILFTDTSFSLVGASTAGLAVGGVAGGSASFSTYYDPGNAAFSEAVELGSTLSGGPGAFSTSSVGILPADGLFSLTQKAVLTHPSAAFSSFNYEILVPEPGMLLMLGAALLALGLAHGRRYRMQSHAEK